MGASVAAHLANVGMTVTLFDVTGERAEAGLINAIQAKPPFFYTPEVAQNVRCGGIAEHLAWLTDIDWVCEAVSEDAETKKTLFAALDPILPGHAVISTCTTCLKVEALADGRSESFRRRFFGTHFAAAPRYVPLLEFTRPPQADPQQAAAFTQFLEVKAGKRVIQTKDAPGFITTRLGLWIAFHAVHTAEKLRIPVELVDEVTAALYGKGACEYLDAFGLDLAASDSLEIAGRCQGDPDVDQYVLPASLAVLLERGCTGHKIGRGYYRSESSRRLVFDLINRAYRDPMESEEPLFSKDPGADLGEQIRKALALRNEGGEFLRNHLIPVLRHVNAVKEKVAHNVVDLDQALRRGLGFPMGPFELMDAVGKDQTGIGGTPFYQVAAFRSFDGEFVAIKAPPQYRTLQDFIVLRGNQHLEVRDIGDDVKVLSPADHRGFLRREAIDEMSDLLESGSFDRFVLHLSSTATSQAFDLQFVLDRAEADDFEAIEKALLRLQHLTDLLASARCVAAVSGRCVGPAFELAMACPRIAAHPETEFGLPAIEAGLLPAGGGTALLRLRNQELGTRAIADCASYLIAGVTSTCAEDARRKGFLRELDKVIHHPDRLLFEAKLLALDVHPQPRPSWQHEAGPLAGMIDRQKQELKPRMGLTAHDDLIADKIKQIFAKAGSFDEALAFERKGFVDLCGKALTLARIRQLLIHGKPLRN
jgi:3-hydroxyacyl-CoA dehydrogenase